MINYPHFMKEIKLFVVLPRLDCGGMGRVVLNLLNELVSRGVEATLVVGQQRGELTNEIPHGVRTLEIAPRGPAFFLSGLIRALRRYRPSHLLCAADDVNCFAIIANRLTGQHAKVLISSHNTLSEQIKFSSGFAHLKTLLVRQAMRWLYPKAHSIVAVSNGVADDLARELGLRRESINVIYNPVVTPAFIEDAAKPLPETWPKGNAPIVLYVGRLVPEKRLDLLLDAFALLPDCIPARLVIAGVGPQLDLIKSQITARNWEKRVTLLGFSPNPLSLMCAANVLVLPSDYEGLPTVLIEALWCGTQIVATDCPSGPAEILAGGRFGKLVKVGAAPELAAAIADSLQGDHAVPSDELRSRAADFDSASAAQAYLRALTGVRQAL